jgi:hypothetical protein
LEQCGSASRRTMSASVRSLDRRHRRWPSKVCKAL